MPENAVQNASLSDRVQSRKFLMATLFNAVVALLIVLDKIPAREGLNNVLYVTMTYLGVEGLVDGAGLLASSKGHALVDAAEVVTGADLDGDGKKG